MKSVSVSTQVSATLNKVWDCWTSPDHIVQWNFATDEWHCPTATNDLRAGGSFSWRMEAKDGSMGFDYAGTYEKVEANHLIEKQLDDDRAIVITFKVDGAVVEVTETFEVEDDNNAELQRQGWQAILNNFKKYVESL